MKKWYEKYIGIPFECNKADMISCDCIGVLFLVTRNELKIDEPRLDCLDWTARKKSDYLRVYKEYLTEIPREEIKEFDIFIQKQKGVYHVGVVIDKTKILQATLHRGINVAPVEQILNVPTNFYRINYDKCNRI